MALVEEKGYFTRLFSPLVLGGVEVKNRIVSSGHDTMLARDGKIGDELATYHETRAAGGVGLIVVQVAGVHESARYTSHMLMANDDSCIEGYRLLAEGIHSHEGAVVGQLFHPGREVLELDEGVRQVAVSASSVPNERGRVTPRALRLAEIREIIVGYGEAAGRLCAAGLDGVEVVASHGYLPSQFLNERVNHRSDEYGAGEEGRQRFLLEVLQSVRTHSTGIVGLRISLDERDEHGLDIEAALGVLKVASDKGLIDYVSVTTGTSATRRGSDHIAPDMSHRAGYTAAATRRVRDVCTVPVMLAGRVNQPQEAERLLEDGSCDAVVMTRALICDPLMPERARRGQLDDIRACVGCNQACIGHFQIGAAISCIQHPETGRELRFLDIRRVESARKAVVVGGGPGGLKAAAVLGSRGFSVELFEREWQLGGQVLLAQMLPGREEFGGVVNNLAREAEKAGVVMHLHSEMRAKDILDRGADVVVVATGADEYVPDIEIMGAPIVRTASEVLRGALFAPGHVIVADTAGDWVGAGVARVLRERGHRVTLVTTGVGPGEALQQYVMDEQIIALAREHVEVMNMTRLFGADDDSVYLEHVLTAERTILSPVSGVVVVGWRRARSGLIDALLDEGAVVIGIGDCMAPRTVEEAVLEGLVCTSSV